MHTELISVNIVRIAEPDETEGSDFEVLARGCYLVDQDGTILEGFFSAFPTDGEDYSAIRYSDYYLSPGREDWPLGKLVHAKTLIEMYRSRQNSHQFPGHIVLPDEDGLLTQ